MRIHKGLREDLLAKPEDAFDHSYIANHPYADSMGWLADLFQKAKREHDERLLIGICDVIGDNFDSFGKDVELWRENLTWLMHFVRHVAAPWTRYQYKYVWAAYPMMSAILLLPNENNPSKITGRCPKCGQDQKNWTRYSCVKDNHDDNLRIYYYPEPGHKLLLYRKALTMAKGDNDRWWNYLVEHGENFQLIKDGLERQWLIQSGCEGMRIFKSEHIECGPQCPTGLPKLDGKA